MKCIHILKSILTLLTILRTVLSISVCVPFSFCCGHQSWQDQLTSSYLVRTVPIKQALLARLASQSSRDVNQRTRGNSPKWSDVTLQFASSVFDLPQLSHSTRAYYEQHLFERHCLSGTSVPSGHVKILTASSQTPANLLSLVTSFFISDLPL